MGSRLETIDDVVDLHTAPPGVKEGYYPFVTLCASATPGGDKWPSGLVDMFNLGRDPSEIKVVELLVCQRKVDDSDHQPFKIIK